MKSRLSLPKDQEAFNEYAKIYKTLKLVSWICQMISFAAGISIVSTFFVGKLQDFIPNLQMVLFVSAVLAFITCFAIEAISRVCTEESVVSIFKKRFRGFDLLLTLLMILGMVVGLGASSTIGFKGGKNAGEHLAGDFKEQSTDKRDSITTRKVLEIESKYRRDSSSLANNYNSQKAAVNPKYSNQITQAASRNQGLINSKSTKVRNADPVEDKDWIAKLKREINSLVKSQKSAKQAVINQRDTEIAALETEKNTKLFDLLESKNLEIASLTKDFNRFKNKVESENETQKDKHEAKTAGMGSGFGWFTVVILLIFVICIVGIKAIEARCGIEEQISVSAYFFSPAITEELKEMVSGWWNWIIRTGINFLSNKKAPPVPIQQVRYDYDMLPHTVRLNYQADTHELQIQNSALLPNATNPDPGTQNLNNEIKNLEFEALQTLQTELEEMKEELQLMKKIVEKTPSERKRIGFETTTKTPLSDTSKPTPTMQGKTPENIPQNAPQFDPSQFNTTQLNAQTIMVGKSMVNYDFISLRIKMYEGRVKKAFNAYENAKKRGYNAKVKEKHKNALKNNRRQLKKWQKAAQDIMQELASLPPLFDENPLK